MNLGPLPISESSPALEQVRKLYIACQFDEALTVSNAMVASQIDAEQKVGTFLLQAQIHLSSSTFSGSQRSLSYARQAVEAAEQYAVPALLAQIQTTTTLIRATIAQKQQMWEQAQAYLQEVLSDPEAIAHSDRVLALYGLSDLMLDQIRMSEAFEWIVQALQLVREAQEPSPFLESIVYNQVAQILIKQHQYDEIPNYARPALESSRVIGDVEEELYALKNLAIYFAAKQDYPSAMDYFLESLGMSERIQCRPITAQCLINIGTIYANLYNHEEAIGKYTQVLKGYGDITTTQTKSVLYNNIGNIYFSTGRLKHAIRFFDQAQELATADGYRQMVARATVQQGRALAALERYEEAEKMAHKAEELIRELPVFNGRQINLITFGLIHFHKKEYDLAEQVMLQAIEEARKQKDDSNEMRAYELLSDIFEAQGKAEEALEYQKKFARSQQRYGLEQRNRRILNLEIQYATKEKERQIELLQKKNEFQRILLERNKRIEIQNAQLKEANEELRQFAYVVSHDLKEPLRMIGSYSTIIHRMYKDLVDEEGALYFQYVKEGVERMDTLLRDLLKYTTVGRIKEEEEDVDLQEVVELAVINLRMKVEETQAKITCGNLPHVKGSKSLLIQLFQNLISNAIKFQRDRVPPQIRIEWTQEPEEGVIRVRDNGIGIAEEYQKRIFEIFQRLHPRTEYEGTGIGLAICQKIVKRFGGEIWLKSTEGEGTTFFFSIPNDLIFIPPVMSTQSDG